MSLFGQRAEWEGAVSRITRKSEDLPEEGTESYGYKTFLDFGIKKGNPRVESFRSGDFFLWAEPSRRRMSLRIIILIFLHGVQQLIERERIR